MRIFVAVKTNVKKEYIERIDETNFRIGVKAIPEKGKANKRIMEILAQFFSIAPSRISLRSGEISKHKVFEIV